MARQIDESKPLSDDDRQWLKDWGRDDVIARIDAAHGVDTEEAEGQAKRNPDDVVRDLTAVMSSHGIDPGDDPASALDSALASFEREESARNQLRTVGNSDSQAPEEAGIQAGYPDDSGSSENNAPPAEDDYEDWLKEELQDELGRRELSKSGNKDELIQRLRDNPVS